jgi:hypothetical protein
MNKKDEDNSIIVLGAISATSSCYLLGLFEIVKDNSQQHKQINTKTSQPADQHTLGLG